MMEDWDGEWSRILLPLRTSMQEAIDERCEELGGLPRSRWIRQAIEQSLTLRCPHPGCEFTTTRRGAICPRHGRRGE